MHKHKGLSVQEKQIKNKQREKKKEKNRQENEGDEFDGILEKYQAKLRKVNAVGESGASFEEVDV